MAGFLLDTNVLIAWFKRLRDFKCLEELIAIPGTRIYTSVVCIAEFYAGCTPADARRLKKILDHGEIGVIPFDKVSVAESAADLRKKHGLKMPDAIVAAAAKERHLTLFTFDRELTAKLAGEVKTYPK